MYTPCGLVVTTTSVPRSTSLTLTLASGITAPAESRTTPAIPPLSFCPTAFGGNAVAATRTARTNGNRLRLLLFIVHRLLILRTDLRFISLSFLGFRLTGNNHRSCARLSIIFSSRFIFHTAPVPRVARRNQDWGLVCRLVALDALRIKDGRHMAGDTHLEVIFPLKPGQASGCEMYVVFTRHGIGVIHLSAVDANTVAEVPAIRKHRSSAT